MNIIKYYSPNKAVKFLNKRVHFDDKSIKINKKFLKRLNEECRLLPAKKGLIHAKYSRDQLLKYVNEVKPR